MLIDDDAAVRRSLGELLETYGFTVSRFASAIKAIEALRGPAMPDCIVMDVRMPDLDGLSAQMQMAEIAAVPPIILITGHGDVAMAVRAMKNGAYDFVEKPIDDEKLVSAIETAITEHRQDQGRLIDRQELLERYQTLTERETGVAKLVAEGHSSAAIAAILGISPRTVDHHRASILAKMRATSLSQLMRHLLDVLK